jgi:protein SCO1
MRSRTGAWPIVVALLAIGVIAGAFVWNRSREVGSGGQQFDVRGVVRGVDSTEATLRVEHEEIPNYMPAMTMSLPVKNRELLRGLNAGDAIAFTLTVTGDDSWISRIDKLSEGAPSARTTTAISNIAGAEPNTARVQPGEKVPEFTILDQHGRARSLSDFRGKAVLVNFIYTRCPLPNFCPLLSSKFADLQQALGTNMPGKFQLISITIDPEHDTPQVLKHYAATWSRDDRTWTFGVADAAELRGIARSFGLIYERTASGQIDHDLRTALIDAQGRLVHVWKSNFWKREEILQRVREL